MEGCEVGQATHRPKEATSDETDKTYWSPARLKKKLFWKRNKLRIATWNITSVAYKNKEIINESRNYDICALSENEKEGCGQFETLKGNTVI